MQMQTITRNGITVTFPAGYQSLEAYLQTLRINHKIACGPGYAGSKNVAKRIAGEKMRDSIAESIAIAEAALADA